MRLPHLSFLPALLLTTHSNAQFLIEYLSFGHTTPFSPSSSSLPGWTLSGTSDHLPQLFSDRLALTPPAPGNKRGALWADHPLIYPEWSVDVEFRASGPERGSGNMQVWLTKEKLPTAASVYTVDRFDGLVIELDQYAGSAGSVRGFLNDGSTSFKGHHNVDGLSFGHCDYVYRNLGRMSRLNIKQAYDGFEVSVDERLCFKTNQVQLPRGYFFGITAASAETPDSFELSKFTVSTTNAITRDEPRAKPPPQQQDQQQQQDSQTPPPPSPEQAPEAASPPDQQQPQQPPEATQQPTSGDTPPRTSPNDRGGIPRNFHPGRTGSNPPDAQFYELLNRMEVATNNINNVYRELKAVDERLQQRHAEILENVANGNPVTAAPPPPPPQGRNVELELLMVMAKRVENIEKVVLELQEEAAGRDYGEHLSGLQEVLRDTKESLLETLPGVVTRSAPRMWFFILVILGSQVFLAGLYVIYKRRRANSPKKFL